MKNALYLDCRTGISGDMTAAALIDLGADQQKLRTVLSSLPLDGFSVHITRVRKAGVDACDFSLDSRDGQCHGHRSLAGIEDILQRSSLSGRARSLAIRIFRIIARAESEVHGVPLDAVRLHEVGALDSIVDVAAVAFCIDNLAIGEVFVPELRDGSGTVRCQHGLLPVPVPVVANIAAAYRLNLVSTQASGEFVTPTGAAIVAALRTSDTLPAGFGILRTGIGAGKRHCEPPGLLRAMLVGLEAIG